jgi:hypothetical protein
MEEPAPAQKPTPRPEPLRFGSWTVSMPLAVSAHAVVYAADGPDGPVAIKAPRVIDPANPRARADAEAIQREAKLLRACAHPHLVRLVQAHDGWFATERVTGEAWAHWAAGRSVDASVGVALEVIAALQAVHRAGVVHGDLKPSHVLIDDWGHARVLDLGVAAPIGERWTQSWTAGFTAPELLSGGKATPAADVYGLAASLYAALSGRPPFDTADPAALAHLGAHSAPIPASAWRADLPDRLDRLLLAMLQRDPALRPELPQVIRELQQAHHSQPARPALGMAGVRMALHREVCRAASGRPVVLHLYGPPGSGRRTLATQAMRLARREGMRIFDKPDPEGFLAALAAGERPATVLRARKEGTQDVAQRVLRGRGAALLITWETRPAPELAEAGAIELSPEPLDLHAARALAAALGAPPVAADDLWRQTGGHPLLLWHALGRCAPGRRLPAPDLSKEAQSVLQAARATKGNHGVNALARTLHMHPLALLEEALVLEAAGLVAFSPDGQTLRAVDPNVRAEEGPTRDHPVVFTPEALAAAKRQARGSRTSEGPTGPSRS